MQVCSLSVSFMAQEAYAIESTTDFSVHLCWLRNFLLDQSFSLMTLLSFLFFFSFFFLCSLSSDVHLLGVLRPVGLQQRKIFIKGLYNSFRVYKQLSGIATAWIFP